ncbi:MAG: hypothetical protein FRX49_03465 [Trebouxia sp. A1-2]|nr:MAG: hypothetical protein FRX49_03465 [Trebouxia sp. A1-2]
MDQTQIQEAYLDRRASWDSQKRLAFTPPASLSSNNRWSADQCPGEISPAVQRQVLMSFSAQQDADRLESSAAVSSQSSLADDVACSGKSQAEAGVRVLQQQQQQQQSQKQLVSQSQWLPAAALDDTGQIGPPITRMRPASTPANIAPARKSSSSKEQAAAVLQTTAEAILVDALLCGWEQHSNDGDLYPLTLALEKEGGGGADLHTLQMATTVQLDLRATNPPLPQGSPSRTKAGKPRPRRRWQQE